MENALDIAIQLIASFEGLRLKPYLDQGGVPTIGFGNTYYEDGTPVTMQDEPISDYDAHKLLEHFVANALLRVTKLVTVHLTPDQLAALTSFEYNTGSLAGHTLLKLLNAGDYRLAAAEFVKWDHVGHTEVQGLFFRRQKERDLFMEGVQ